MKLNLGCADRKFDGFLGVDICPPAEIIADLSKRWPWDDSSIEAIKAFDIIEHLPDRILTMNEAWRVLQQACEMEIEVPDAIGPGAYQDPTHVSYWTMNSFQYFEHGSFAQKRFAKAYGIKASFIIDKLERIMVSDVYDDVPKIHAILRAAK